MTNHPNRNKQDAQSIACDKALKTLIKGHARYREVDREGRQNIRRNISSQLFELWAGHTADELVAAYKSAFWR